MTTQAASQFALSFSNDAVHLLERTAPPESAAPWRERGRALFDAQDFRLQIGALRDTVARQLGRPLPAAGDGSLAALVAALGSPTLNEQMDNLLARMRLTFLLAIPRYPQLHADHIQGNITLATLIADGKRDEAATLTHDSLMNTCGKILAVLED